MYNNDLDASYAYIADMPKKKKNSYSLVLIYFHDEKCASSQVEYIESQKKAHEL